MTCHRPHHSANARLAVEPTTDLCSQCHDLKEKAFAAAHLAIEAKAIDCMSCHNPHASKDPKMMKAKVHAPFGSRKCDACHVVEKR
jgi:predicted CXXCH cytochrome family protein